MNTDAVLAVSGGCVGDPTFLPFPDCGGSDEQRNVLEREIN